MSLPPGSRVGIYEVVELIGVGGMGEVYRARDSRLDRAVAIKTLPEEFAVDADRLARFEREAKVLAQLNHPHIASIYGLEIGTPVALAMEMVEGETLAQRIADGPIPIDEALIIARQIADALEHAHAKGIIHRDLKPANIKAGPREAAPVVKVLDFGLAKAMDQGSGIGDQGSGRLANSPTITSPANLTRAGIVLGTAAYMSPEQARGRHVDQRADIWAFGCVLYEMIAGRRAFEGEAVADVLARVIQSEPDWTLLPAATPSNLKTLLRRCLRKDLHQRLHSIADVRIELEESVSGANDAPAAATPRRMNAWLPAVAGLAAGAIIATAGVRSLYRPPPVAEPSVIRVGLSPPAGWILSRVGGSGRLQFALSPDGEKVAAVLVGPDARRKVFVRGLNDTEFRELPGTDMATSVFWSPDSARVAFSTGTGLLVTDLNGGGARSITTLAAPVNASWSTTDLIAAQAPAGNPLTVWPANSNLPKPMAALPSGVQARVQPHWMQDGKRLLFADASGGGTLTLRAQEIVGAIVDVTPFESRGAGSWGFEYQSGHLLLCVTEASGRTVLTAQALDATTLRLSGTPTVIATDVNCAFSASSNGRLGVGGNRFMRSRFVWLDARGTEVGSIPLPADRSANFDLSHNERFLAVEQASGLVVHDLARGATSSLSVRGTDPTWSPDDREIAYTVASGEIGGILAVPAFGGAPRVLLKTSIPTYIEDWSMDGRWLAATVRGDGQLIPLPNGTPIPLGLSTTTTAVDELQFSPDSHWVAYGLLQANNNEVFLTAVPPTGQRWQLSSVGGGATPRWSLDGRSLTYLNMSGVLMRVDLTFGPGAAPQISAPRRLVQAVTRVEPTLDQYAMSKTGRYIVRKDVEGSPGELDTIQIIVNWPKLINAGNTGPRQ